jgi:putative NADPH-quinone reductase
MSFNGAMYRAAVETLLTEGHEVETSDLYQMDFDPVSERHNFTTVKDPNYFKPQIEEVFATEADGFAEDIENEIEKIEWCDLMIWQFPLWWFGLPGILKGWVDRVFAMGRTYGGDKLYANGVFRDKKALLSLTTGGPAPAYVKGGLPIWTSFLARRMKPALRTCVTIENRQSSLSQKLARAANLLRTRVDVELEQQNQELLKSMNARTRLQLRLQTTVEGHSVAAITYYVVGLFGYLVKAAHDSGRMMTEPSIVTAAFVPIAALAIWWTVRRIRKKNIAGED